MSAPMSFLSRLTGRLHAWFVARDVARNARKLNRAFPPDTRIVVTSGCHCGHNYIGRLGTVEGLTSFGGDAEDYRVYIDGDVFEFESCRGQPRYQLICGRALKKADLR